MIIKPPSRKASNTLPSFNLELHVQLVGLIAVAFSLGWAFSILHPVSISFTTKRNPTNTSPDLVQVLSLLATLHRQTQSLCCMANGWHILIFSSTLCLEPLNAFSTNTFSCFRHTHPQGYPIHRNHLRTW